MKTATAHLYIYYKNSVRIEEWDFTLLFSATLKVLLKLKTISLSERAKSIPICKENYLLF